MHAINHVENCADERERIAPQLQISVATSPRKTQQTLRVVEVCDWCAREVCYTEVSLAPEWLAQTLRKHLGVWSATYQHRIGLWEDDAGLGS